MHILTIMLSPNFVDMLPILDTYQRCCVINKAREAKRVAHRMLENPFKAAKDCIIVRTQILIPPNNIYMPLSLA